MTTAFDPYHQWLGISPPEQPANHYRLLGVRQFEADPNVLQHAADQRMAHLRTFQSGPRGPLSQRLLNEVAAAARCLLSPNLRARYDEELRHEQSCSSTNAPIPVVPMPAESRQSNSYMVAAPPSFTVPPPVPPPRTSTSDLASASTQVHVAGALVGRRGHQSTNAMVAVAKVFAGGIAGLACGVVVVWLVGGVDLLGQLGIETRARQQAKPSTSTSSPIAPPLTTVKATPKSTHAILAPVEIAPGTPAPPLSPDSVVDIPDTTPTAAKEQPQPRPMTLAEFPVYLSDLRPIEVVALQVPAAPVRVRQQQSAHGIFLHPAANSTAKIAFNLARSYRLLTGAAALNDSANGPALSELTMRIVGDGQTLWTSRPIQVPGTAEAFRIDVTGVARLELQVQCPGADGRAHAAWFAVMADPNDDAKNEELEKLLPSGKPKPKEQPELPTAKPATEKAKLPRPSPDKLTAAEKTFGEVMGSEIAAAKSLEAKAKLADKLLQLGASSAQDAASQYVVLSAACSKAVDLSQLLKGLALLEQRFDGDLTDVRLLGFESVKGQITAQQIEQFAETLLGAIESAERKDRFEAAEQISKIGQASGRKFNDRRLTDAFVDRGERIAKLANAYSLVKPSLLAAQANPDDQDAAFRAGQYIAYVRNDWKVALPLLARTTDEELDALVQEDLKNPTEAAEVLKLADRWWERAESSSALSQEGMRRRATHWYRLIPPGKLQGLEAQKVAKRISETETDWLAGWRPHSPAATFAKQVVGRYRLFTTDLGLKERTRRGLVTLEPNHDVKIETETGVVAHWRQDGQLLRFDFTADGRGHVELQSLRNRQWAGHHHRPSDKTVWGWELIAE
jgi:hypothetical protein